MLTILIDAFYFVIYIIFLWYIWLTATIHLTFLTLEEVPSLYLWSISQDIEASFLYQFTQNQHGNTNHRNFLRTIPGVWFGLSRLVSFWAANRCIFVPVYGRHTCRQVEHQCHARERKKTSLHQQTHFVLLFGF